MSGKFVISLDFELMWGVRDKRTIENYGDSTEAVHAVIPRLLQQFNRYGVHATFSIVGLLFFESKEEILKALPRLLPNYKDKNLSPYINHFEKVGQDYLQDKHHFAPLLIKEIQKNKIHEIGTHTFSHYYCLEKGQNIEEFKEDIFAAKAIAKLYGIHLKSIVFPRNQCNKEYLEDLSKQGILSYRGTEKSWLYRAKAGEEESKLRRVLRLVDSFINISGHNTYSDQLMFSTKPINIPSSRLLRAHSKRLKFLNFLKLNRIKSGMLHAAKTNTTYHLWWHPHNFGRDVEKNFIFLEEILKYYQFLNAKYEFQSKTMTEIAEQNNYEV